MKTNRIITRSLGSGILLGLLLGGSPLVSADNGMEQATLASPSSVRAPFKAANPTFRPGRTNETAEFAQLDVAPAAAMQSPATLDGAPSKVTAEN